MYVGGWPGRFADTSFATLTQRQGVLDYLDEFYEVISSEERSTLLIEEACRSA